MGAGALVLAVAAGVLTALPASAAWLPPPPTMAVVMGLLAAPGLALLDVARRWRRRAEAAALHELQALAAASGGYRATRPAGDAGGAGAEDRPIVHLVPSLAVALLIVAVLGGLGQLRPQEPEARRWSFIEPAPTHELGLRVAADGGGSWRIARLEHATGARALVNHAGEPGHPPAMVLAGGAQLRDLAVATRCQNAAGSRDRACGVVARYQDPGSFYLARIDAARERFEVVATLAGEERVIAAVPAPSPQGWQEIQLQIQGFRVQGWLNGRRVVDVVDQSIPASGEIGLWAPSECVAHFDELAFRKLSSRSSGELLRILQLGS